MTGGDYGRGGGPAEKARGAASPEEIRRRLASGAGRRRAAGWLVLGAALAAAVVSFSPLAGVEAVEVEGAPGREDPRVGSATDLVGESIVWVDADKLERELEQVPWVEQATVKKDLPARKLRVSLVRRTPAGFIRGESGAVLVDAAGIAFEVTSSIPPGTLELTGEIGPVGLGSASDEVVAVVSCARGLARWSREPFVSGGIARGVVFLVSEGGAVVRVGDTSDLEAKGRALRAMQERAEAEKWTVAEYTVVAPQAPALRRA